MKKIIFTTMLAVAGIATGLLIQALSSTPAQPDTAHAGTERAAGSGFETGHPDDRRPSRELRALGATLAQTQAQGALAGRIEELERRLDQQAEVAGGFDEMDEEAQRRADEQAEQMVQEQFQTHDDAAVDPAWAEPARQSLLVEMMDLADKLQDQARIEDLDCRAGSCKATVEFPSCAAAMAGYSPYMNHFYQVNCAITAALETAENPNAPYQLELLFHQCS